MLELCLVKVFEKFLHITFENVYFSFGYRQCLMGTIQQGAYYLQAIYIHRATGMVHNVNGT